MEIEGFETLTIEPKLLVLGSGRYELEEPHNFLKLRGSYLMGCRDTELEDEVEGGIDGGFVEIDLKRDRFGRFGERVLGSNIHAGIQRR